MDSLSLFHRFTNSQTPAPLIEAWGDVVPSYDSGWWEDSGGGLGSTLARYQRPATTLYDRNDGRFLPVYQTEFDLAVIRAMGRTLAVIAPGLVGGMRNLCNYTIGEGFTFTATREATASIGDEEAGPLVQAIQVEINSLLDDNEFVSGLDREIHDCSIVDGESLLHVRPNAAGKVRIYRREPDELRQPANTRELEEWVQDTYGTECDSFVSSWSFGVHTRADQPDEPLGYHLVADESGVNWEYVPADRMVHIKRNVTRNAKRGFSDFYPVEPDSARGEKLRRNMAEGAAVQSAIAFVRQHVAGTTRVGVEAMLGDNKTGTSRQPAGYGSSRARNVVQYQPGTVVDLSAGLEYKAGPLGSERASDFLLVAAYVQRMQAVRWSMPEYMFSGDASNANYASTMEATAPFVKSCEAEQRFYSKHFVSLLWKALKIRWEMGAFDQFDIAWEDLVAWIKIKAECPEVATRDELQNVQRQEILIKLGILSRKTAATQNGLDYEAEVANGAKAEGEEGQGGAGAAGSGAGGPAGPAPAGGEAPCQCAGASGDLEAETEAAETDVPESLTESVLIECGGKGGKPGPCPSAVKKAKKWRRVRKIEKGKRPRPSGAHKVTSGDSASTGAAEPADPGSGLTDPVAAGGTAASGSAPEPPSEPSAPSVTASVRNSNPCDRRKQNFARKVQENGAKQMKGKSVGDNAPADQKVNDAAGNPHFHEVKCLMDRKTHDVTVRNAALDRKARSQVETGIPYSTLVEDHRDIYNKTQNQGKYYSGHKLYYKRGAGTFDLSEMYPVDSYEDILRLDALPDHLLPELARPTKKWTDTVAAVPGWSDRGKLKAAMAIKAQAEANDPGFIAKGTT